MNVVENILEKRHFIPDVEKCELCPIEYKGFHSTVARTKLPFDIGCGMDDICQSFIFAKPSLPNVT